MFRDVGIGAARISERQIPSYLWENWKSDLEKRGYDWHQFQSDISSASSVMQRWGRNEAEWEEVMNRIEQVLGIDIVP